MSSYCLMILELILIRTWTYIIVSEVMSLYCIYSWIMRTLNSSYPWRPSGKSRLVVPRWVPRDVAQEPFLYLHQHYGTTYLMISDTVLLYLVLKHILTLLCLNNFFLEFLQFVNYIYYYMYNLNIQWVTSNDTLSFFIVKHHWTLRKRHNINIFFCYFLASVWSDLAM